MFEQKQEIPVAEEERKGLVERRRSVAPGQKLILVATSTVAALLILFGIASKNNYFGVFGAHWARYRPHHLSSSARGGCGCRSA
jgi:type IV secretion system protein VirB10